MDNQMYYFSPYLYLFWVIPICSFLIFYLRYRHNKVKLVDGIWFNLFFYSLLFCLAITIIGTHNSVLIYGSIGIFFLILGVILIFFGLQALFWIWNGILMWRRESHTLANTLTLIIGIAIILIPFINNILQPILPHALYLFGIYLWRLCLLYVLGWGYNFLTVALLYQFNKPTFDQDYIIVLGAGLMHGDQVTPLLAARIQRAMTFHFQQIQQTGKAAAIIFSGGQGRDETVPEGQAMLDYAVAHGMPRQYGIAEVKSLNTYQNMRNSKEIIEQRPGSHNVIFVTNNYHTYRAARMAREVGLNADGIGAKTSWFFVPDALIREYVAIFLKYKKWHIAFLIVAIIYSAWLAWPR